MNDFLCIFGGAIGILMLLGIWGMKDMPMYTGTRPPEHPPGYRNMKRKKSRKQER